MRHWYRLKNAWCKPMGTFCSESAQDVSEHLLRPELRGPKKGDTQQCTIISLLRKNYLTLLRCVVIPDCDKLLPLGIVLLLWHANGCCNFATH